ncbi:hypothetical protein GCM10022255_111260 [Dactylosporangium darangshiense]|uniref:Uncharacterized protein n=1 Tax=Dactylosporangium darangshiense TaxID=579108 RepID=A0ABP8DUW5_9ACTN
MALACGGAYLIIEDRARERSDQMIREYLNALTRGEYGAAYGLLCDNEDVDRAWFESKQGRDPIRSFVVERSGDWGNLMDGSGRGYSVRVTLASGISTVEYLTTKYASDGDSCVTH